MPAWLPYSGLPAKFREAGPRGRSAYLLLHRIMDLDEGRNSTPGTVEIPLSDLADLCAIDPKDLRQAIPILRRLHLIKCFIPDGDEEVAAFQICTPMTVPATREQIISAWRALAPHTTDDDPYLRYIDPPRAGQARMIPDTNFPDAMPILIDLYFGQCGFKMNAFIIDHLNRIACTYTVDEIRAAFRRAAKNEIRFFPQIIGFMRQARAAKKQPRNI